MTNRSLNDDEGESFAEEIANTITHGIGAVLSVAGLVVMVLLATVSSNPWSVAAVAVFGSMLILLYLISALYHGAAHGKAKRVLKILDHVTIFLLIAGTYTPIALLAWSSGPDWLLLATIWSLALFGIVVKIVWAGRFKGLRIALYVAMGWLVIAWGGPLIASMGWGGTGLLLAGGIAYTGGIAFYAWDSLPFNHAIWHLFVLAGSAAHFLAIVFFVI
jgi:hemolysin III